MEPLIRATPQPHHQKSAEYTVPLTFPSFYETEYRQLVGFCYVLSGDWTTAEDLAQDAMMQAHRHWSKVSGYEDPGGWARRVAINRHRSKLRRISTETKTMLGLRTQRMQTVSLPIEIDHMFSLVRRLPDRQGQAIALKYWDDFSINQIASVLGCGTETVKTHLKRGRAALAEMIEEEFIR